MLEKCKWQREFHVFSRLVNTIVLTGNTGDQHPVINEQEQKIQGFCSLEVYLARSCQSMGYQAVVFYNPIGGFYTIPGFQQKADIIALVETIAAEAGSQGPGDGPALSRRSSSQGTVSLTTGSVEDAARIINLVLTQSCVSTAVIVGFSSRMTARPDDLDMGERMVFMNFQEGAVNAKRNRAGDPSSAHFQDHPILQNQLVLIADKLNDLPAWYYLSHPSFKNIHIPKPDYQLRSQIIQGYSANFPGYSGASEEEKQLFNDLFVGASDGFTTRDIARVFQLARGNSLDIHGIDKAILLYEHGVQENPWLRLDAKRLAGAEEQIKKRVLGQDAAVRAAVNIVKRAAMGMSGLQHSSASSKPRGILFLAGPTGTGKTELAKALTELVFLDERNMIRFDMSEYRQEQSDQRLLGAPPGYVGYEAGGQLTNAVREHPFSVLLFDEIEKAHPTVLDKFLQILEDGRITDGRGETVYFQDCFIIFTSNLGMTVPDPENPGVRMRNVSYGDDYQMVHDKILSSVQRYFNEELGRPELLNRIGNNILVFDYIREDCLWAILEKQVSSIARNLWADKRIHLTVSREAEESLFRLAAADLPNGQGGRGIGNLMEAMLLNPLAGFLFDNGVLRDAAVTVEQVYEEDGAAKLKALIG